MTDILIYTPTRFAVPQSGFDSEKRYMRKVSSGATLAISAGRTWRIGYAGINTDEPWCGFRFDIGIPGVAIDAVSTTVNGFTSTHSIAAVGPTLTLFALQ